MHLASWYKNAMQSCKTKFSLKNMLTNKAILMKTGCLQTWLIKDYFNLIKLIKGHGEKWSFSKAQKKSKHKG